MAARRKKTTRTPSAKAARSKAEREFVSEAEEILERMREDMADLHDQRNDPDQSEVDPDLVNRIFRSAHSLKGLAGMFGLDGLSDLAHHLEDILDGLRLGRLSFDSPSVALLDEAVELFSTLLGKLGDDVFAEESSEVVAALVARIESSCSEPPAIEDELERLALDPALLRALTEYEEHRLRENFRRGRHLALVDTSFEIIAFEEGLSEISAAIREVGEVVSTLPSPGEAPESQIRFALLAATDIPADQLEARLEFPDTSVRIVHDASAPDQAGPSPTAPQSESEPMAEAVERDGESSDAAPPPAAAEPVARVPDAVGDSSEFESLRSISETVRVDIRKLDELMNLVGELVIQRSAIGQIAGRLSGESETARIGSELSKVYKLLDRKLKELQAGVLDVRMVPLRQVFEKLSRVVRRLRRDLGKDVNISFRGADTELDKLIMEQLIDPLMHVVRNSLDHAIESAEERVGKGKPAEGTLHIEASQRGNHVTIEVRDDGRGIDVAAVRAKAEARGLISSEDLLSDKETLALIFHAGLSTREEVSETSGRGVGMDVVRSNLTALGGIVDVSSRRGEGTTVTMTLPITLAIIQALIVGVDRQRFAIPLNSVLETLLVEPGEIQRSEDREILNLRGEALALRRLSDEFQLPRAPDESKMFAVVLGLGELRMGLLVDRLEGQQDTVIKSIHGPIQKVRGIAGATELGDQGAVLVLDVSVLVEDTVRRRDAA